MTTAENLHEKSHEELVAIAEALQSQRDAAVGENEKLRQIVRDLQRRQYGQSSEKLNDDQLNLLLEDLSQNVAAQDLQVEEATPDTGERQQRRREKQPRRNQGRLPNHLEREDVVIEPEAGACPDCQGDLHVIGEDVSEQLDYVPAKLKVKRIRRPRYGCRGCESGIEQAPAPDRLLTGGIATPGLIAHVLVSKFADHLPLYRQAEMLAREGVELDRSTLATWVGRAAWLLEPVRDAVHAHVLEGDRVFGDDTPLPVLEPGRGKTKTGYLWAYARDDTPFQGSDPPAVAYWFSPDRTAENPRKHLEGYRGILQADAYAGYKNLLEDADKRGLRLVLCWAHLRRQLYDVYKATGSPIASEALRRIQDLYAVEKDVRGKPAEVRQRERDERARPVVEAMHPWLEQQLAAISGKSKLAKAIRYALTRWSRFTAFLDDGQIELDNNVVERTIRPITLGRKNALFAGADSGGRHWAIVASLIHSAKLNGVEPHGYLRDVLERLIAGHPINRVQDLVPWAYPASMPRATA